MKTNRKAGVPINLLVGFVLAVFILSLAYLFVQILLAAPGISGVDIGAEVTLNATTTSRVCNYDLINFLRATDSESGLEYAQLLAVDSNKFQDRAEQFFNNNFHRGYTGVGWRLVVTTPDFKPVATAGTLETMPIRESCTQYVPGLTLGEYYIIKLGTEY